MIKKPRDITELWAVNDNHVLTNKLFYLYTQLRCPVRSRGCLFLTGGRSHRKNNSDLFQWSLEYPWWLQIVLLWTMEGENQHSSSLPVDNLQTPRVLLSYNPHILFSISSASVSHFWWNRSRKDTSQYRSPEIFELLLNRQWSLLMGMATLCIYLCQQLLFAQPTSQNNFIGA